MERTIKFYSNKHGQVQDISKADYVIETREMTLEELKKEYPLIEIQTN